MTRRSWTVLGVAAVAVAMVVTIVLVRRDAPLPVGPAEAPLAQNLQAQLTGPAKAVVGKPVELTGFAVGSATKPRTVSFCFGDGPCPRSVLSCPAGRPEPPKPASLEDKRPHSFLRVGTFTVRFEVDSGCAGYVGTASAVLQVKVVARL